MTAQDLDTPVLGVTDRCPVTLARARVPRQAGHCLSQGTLVWHFNVSQGVNDAPCFRCTACLDAVQLSSNPEKEVRAFRPAGLFFGGLFGFKLGAVQQVLTD